MRTHSMSRLTPVLTLCSTICLGGCSPSVKLHHPEFSTRQLTSEYHGEGASAGDFDNDGVQDVVSGSYWYEGPDFATRHAIYPPVELDEHKYSDNFFAFPWDFDGDGWQDVLFIGFPGKAADWYENPGDSGSAWRKHRVFESVDNESPTFADIDGDGRPELVCMTGNRIGFARVDWDHPEKPWQFQALSPLAAGGRFTHGLGLADINDDGRLDVLWKHGWFEQPEDLESSGNWQHHPVRFSGPRGAAQMYAFDIDGDGDQDVIAAFNAHGYGLNWFEQQRDASGIRFVKHVIMGETAADNPHGVVFSNIHAMDIADLNGDGLPDLVAGNRFWFPPKNKPKPGQPVKDRGTPCLYWFELARDSAGVEFIPRCIETSAGVGTQLVIHDVDGNGLQDVVVGNKAGTFVYLHAARPATEVPGQESKLR